MGILGHNFDSRHAIRSSKGSIDAGDYLVSKKVSAKILTKTPSLCEPVTGEPFTQIKTLFLIEPRRLVASVEGLNNSLAIAAGEL